MTKLFVSYNHRDSVFVDRLIRSLGDSFNIWMDRIRIKPSVSLIEQVAAHIETSDYMLAVISSNSVRSRWVRKELAIADTKPISIVAVITDNCRIPATVSHLPYIDFKKQPAPYKKALQQLVNMLDRAVVVSNNVVLSRFGVWGGVTATGCGEYGCKINSKGNTAQYGGLTYDEIIHTVGYKKVIVEVSGSLNCDFSGWRKEFLKMMKIELNGIPLLADKVSLRSADDATYVEPSDAVFQYPIPRKICEDGYIKKFEIVFGKGKIKNLNLKVSFI